jgi:hypothetical protein
MLTLFHFFFFIITTVGFKLHGVLSLIEGNCLGKLEQGGGGLGFICYAKFKEGIITEEEIALSVIEDFEIFGKFRMELANMRISFDKKVFRRQSKNIL